MSRFWTDRTRALEPYVPGEQRQGASIVKLNTNENPYPPSPAVMAAIASVSGNQLRRYPDPESLALREALARREGLAIQEVFVGNGSDEVLAFAFMAFFAGAKGLQFPDVSYSFYPVYCQLFDIEPRRVPLDAQFQLSLTQFTRDGRGIIFPNPNAPTGRAVTGRDIALLLEEHPDQLVIVDEAYAGYGAESVVSLVREFPNLLVTQTFSKNRSLAGMRLGMAYGASALIEGLQRVKNSFNSYPIDTVASAAGIASLLDEVSHREILAAVISTRTRLTEELEKRRFEVLPSAANFVFARPPEGKACELQAALAEKDILVRYWNRQRLAEWLRISIGTDAEIDRLLAGIDEVKL